MSKSADDFVSEKVRRCVLARVDEFTDEHEWLLLAELVEDVHSRLGDESPGRFDLRRRVRSALRWAGWLDRSADFHIFGWADEAWHRAKVLGLPRWIFVRGIRKPKHISPPDDLVRSVRHYLKFEVGRKKRANLADFMSHTYPDMMGAYDFIVWADFTRLFALAMRVVGWEKTAERRRQWGRQFPVYRPKGMASARPPASPLERIVRRIMESPA